MFTHKGDLDRNLFSSSRSDGWIYKLQKTQSIRKSQALLQSSQSTSYRMLDPSMDALNEGGLKFGMRNEWLDSLLMHLEEAERKFIAGVQAIGLCKAIISSLSEISVEKTRTTTPKLPGDNTRENSVVETLNSPCNSSSVEGENSTGVIGTVGQPPKKKKNRKRNQKKANPDVLLTGIDPHESAKFIAVEAGRDYGCVESASGEESGKHIEHSGSGKSATVGPSLEQKNPEQKKKEGAIADKLLAFRGGENDWDDVAAVKWEERRDGDFPDSVVKPTEKEERRQGFKQSTGISDTFLDFLSGMRIFKKKPGNSSQDNRSVVDETVAVPGPSDTNQLNDSLSSGSKKVNKNANAQSKALKKKKFMKILYPDHSPELVFEKLDEDSEKFQEIYNKAKVKIGPKKTLLVEYVLSVKNVYLTALYDLKKLDLRQTHGAGVTEKQLFHAATSSNVYSICNENFDYRLSGTSRGHLYGRGISFSPSFLYANHFSDKRSDLKMMLLCKVLYVDAHVGDANTLVPDDGYDSTKRENGKVIVKYDDDVFLPEYVIYYRIIQKTAIEEFMVPGNKLESND